VRRKPLFLRPESRKRCLQALGQAARAIVVAHTIKHIGHCSIPPKLKIAPQTYKHFMRATIHDNLDAI
jgi:hypothetical protein